MPTPIDRDELQRLRREEHAQLVEVLPAEEFDDEHLPAAINIPLKTLDAESTASLDRQRPVTTRGGYETGTPGHARESTRGHSRHSAKPGFAGQTSASGAWTQPTAIDRKPATASPSRLGRLAL